jgi:hypothetical protein
MFNSFKSSLLLKNTATMAALLYFIVYSAHFLQKHYDEILPAHYTWKVPEKGFKIN